MRPSDGPTDDGVATSSVRQALTTAVHTKFDPTVDMFAFDNAFKNYNELPSGLDFRSGGLCGGMTYSALDYWNAHMAIPNQTYRPAEATQLQRYIYGRQITSLWSNVDKWAEVMFNPFGVRNQEFFDWGLKDRIPELRSYLDAGIPVPLGLKGTNGTGDHQVLAIGYDMGRYQGDLGWYEGDFKIFVADPNHPGTAMTLVPNLDTQRFTYFEEPNNTGHDEWVTYFVDANYHPQTPPNLTLPTYPDDGLIHELLVAAMTGSDDMRGGDDDVNLTLNMVDGSTIPLGAINRGARWISNYDQTQRMVLPRAVRQIDVASITLADTFSGGWNGDNWDMTSVLVSAVGHPSAPWPIAQSGFHRFQADDSRSITLPIGPLPPLPPPIANFVFPPFGAPEGGTPIRVDGDNFDINGRTRIFVGGREVSGVTCAAPTTCSGVVPAGVGIASVQVVVSGVATRLTDGTLYGYVPSLLDLSKHTGNAGDVITIQGLGLQPGASVSFGSYPATQVSCDGTDCDVAVPPGTGVVEVRVTSNGHTTPSVATDTFQYGGPAVSSLSVQYGPITGVTDLTVEGVNFDTAIGGTQVLFDGVPATDVTCDSSTSCSVRSPAAAQVGSVHVQVRAFGQTSPATPLDLFFYEQYPELTTFTYGQLQDLRLNGAAPAGGAQVTITSSDWNVLPPTTLTIPAGQLGLSFFSLPIAPSLVAENLAITASYKWSQLTTSDAIPASPPVFVSVAGITPFDAGQTTTGTVTLGAPAPAGGAVVTLATNATYLTIPAQVVVPAGSHTATFAMTSDYSGLAKLVPLTATYGSTSRSTNVTVGAPLHNFGGGCVGTCQ